MAQSYVEVQCPFAKRFWECTVVGIVEMVVELEADP